MSVAEMQAMFARLCVDDTFQQLFQLSPETAIAKYSLTEAEVAALKGIDSRMLSLFSRSLRAKQRMWLPKSFPLCWRGFQNKLEFYFNRYYDLHPPQWQITKEARLLTFGSYLSECFAADSEVDDLIRDICRYECTMNELSSVAARAEVDRRPPTTDDDLAEAVGNPATRIGLDPSVRLVYFHYQIIDVVQALGDRLLAEIESRPQATWMVFHLHPGQMTPQAFVISDLVAKLLEECALATTIGDLRKMLASRLKNLTYPDGTLDQAIKQLALSRLITIDVNPNRTWEL